MIGKFVKYLFLDKEGRDTWDKIQALKKMRKNADLIDVEQKAGIPILNTPFTAKPGESGIIFPDSNPEEQIKLIEMAIGEAKRIEDESESLTQLPPPEPTKDAPSPPLKKKTLKTDNVASSRQPPTKRPLVDIKVGEDPPKKSQLNANHSNQKIDAICEAMKIYHDKQSSLSELDTESRTKLKIMADTMMGIKS